MIDERMVDGDRPSREDVGERRRVDVKQAAHFDLPLRVRHSFDRTHDDQP
jgi:hypothetical protein